MKHSRNRPRKKALKRRIISVIIKQTIKQEVVETLAKTIRKHWGVESNNWQLDVTFGEDQVRVKHGNQSQVMGGMRCFAMNLLRWSKQGLDNCPDND